MVDRYPEGLCWEDREDEEKRLREFADQPGQDRSVSSGHLGHLHDQLDRERQENAAAGVEIVEKEVEEESLAVGCQGRPGLSRELVTNVNRRWAHWSTTGEAAAAADDAAVAAAAATAAAAADAAAAVLR